ncbi:hypothetical protein Tco_0458416 [Tanacetum coccineum]
MSAENPSSSPIPVVDSNFLIEEVDTFLVPEDSIPPGIESDLDSEGDIVFLENLLYEDLIPEYERFTFEHEPEAPMINTNDDLMKTNVLTQGRIARILKTLVLGVLSIVHSLFNPSHAYIGNPIS